MEEKITAIYYIKDLRNDKIIYIGQTRNFEGRKKCHFTDKRNSVDNFMFSQGRENFSMEIFEDIDCTNLSEEEILKKEDELIEYYDTINNGLNKIRSGNISKDDSKKYFREYDRKYRKTEKRKEYLKKYYSTEEYKERKREACREYRVKKKAEKSANTESL